MVTLLSSQAVHQHLVAVQLVLVELLPQPVAARGQTVWPLHQLLVYLVGQRLELPLHTHLQPSHLGGTAFLLQQLTDGVQYLRTVPQFRNLLGLQVVAVLARNLAVVFVGLGVQQQLLPLLEDAAQ